MLLNLIEEIVDIFVHFDVVRLNTNGLFGSCFLKLFLRTVFENTVNTIFVFSENCSYALNLVFSLFS